MAMHLLRGGAISFTVSGSTVARRADNRRSWSHEMLLDTALLVAMQCPILRGPPARNRHG